MVHLPCIISPCIDGKSPLKSTVNCEENLANEKPFALTFCFSCSCHQELWLMELV